MIYCQFLASLWLTSCNTYISTCNNSYVILSFWTNLLQAKNRWHQWWLLHENFASICHVLPLKSEFSFLLFDHENTLAVQGIYLMVDLMARIFFYGSGITPSYFPALMKCHFWTYSSFLCITCPLSSQHTRPTTHLQHNAMDWY